MTTDVAKLNSIIEASIDSFLDDATNVAADKIAARNAEAA